jgi:hypothetical protein
MTAWGWRLLAGAVVVAGTASVTWFVSATQTWDRLPVTVIGLAWLIAGGVLGGLCLIQAIRVDRRPLDEAKAHLRAAVTEHMRSIR